jgi:hypothetical protein
MKFYLSLLFATSLVFTSCGDGIDDDANKSDSISSKDSLKQKITEDLPPSTDIKQFEWIYSSFVAASTYSVRDFNIFISPEHGLWIIRSNGALPEMINVKSVVSVKNAKGDSLVPMDREKMICTPSAESLPVEDCTMPSRWSKSGCYTSETNIFKEQKIWQYAGLNDGDSKKVEELSRLISRVVINTEMNTRFYFGEIKGTWYLLFIDIRVPCEA